MNLELDMIKRVENHPFIYREVLQGAIPTLFATSVLGTTQGSAFMSKRDVLDMVWLVTN